MRVAQASACSCCPLPLRWRQLHIDCVLPHSWTVSFHHHVSCGPHTHLHILFVVLFPAGLPYLLSPSLAFLYVFSTSFFSIWNLFYPLSGSIDPLSSRPPASWCPPFTVTQAIIACRSLLIIPMLAAVLPADAIQPSRISSQASRRLPGLLLWPENSPCGLAWKTKSSQTFLFVETSLFGWRLENRWTSKHGFAYYQEREKAYIFSGFDVQWFLWTCP